MFLHKPLYLCKIFTIWQASSDKLIGKVSSEDSLTILGDDDLKFLKESIGIVLTVTIIYSEFRKIHQPRNKFWCTSMCSKWFFAIIWLVRLFQLLFNPDLNCGCLVYMFSLRFSESKCLINLRRQYHIRKTFSRRHFHTQVFAGFAVFSFCVKITILEIHNLCSSLLSH